MICIFKRSPWLLWEGRLEVAKWIRRGQLEECSSGPGERWWRPGPDDGGEDRSSKCVLVVDLAGYGDGLYQAMMMGQGMYRMSANFIAWATQVWRHICWALHFPFFHIGPFLYLITPMVILSNPIAVNSTYMLMPKLTFPWTLDLTT